MRFAVLHVETTGNEPNDEIIQIGFVILSQHLHIEYEYDTLVRPTVPIPEHISQLTGIAEKDVQNAPHIEEVMIAVVPLLHDAVLVGHDMTCHYLFLCQALEQTGYLPFTGRVVDTIRLLPILFPSMPSFPRGCLSYKKESVHERLYPLDRATSDRTDSDVRAVAHTFVRCLQALDHLPLLTLQRVVELLDDQEEQDLKWLFAQKLKEREAGGWLEEEGYHPYRQIMLKQADWTEMKPSRAPSEQPLKGVTFTQFLEQVTANLASQLDGYELRESQEKMFHEVMSCFAQEHHLLIEAGTGTGKSLGYLLPSIYQSVSQESKVIISTHTTHLQEQLKQRDLPLLEKIVSFSFQASVLKGRSHYLCLRKFEHKINSREFIHSQNERLTAAQMMVWLSETEHGDEEELHFIHKGAAFWETVASNSDSCFNRDCPWFRRCFYHRARHHASLADIIITNHSLLFTDIIAEHRLLPAYKQLVIDEAHHFEETAGKHLGIHLQYFSLIHPFMRLFKDSKNGRLVLLQQHLRLSGKEQALVWAEGIDKLLVQLMDVRNKWDYIHEQLFQMLPSKGDTAQAEGGQMVLRLVTGHQPDGWSNIVALENDMYIGLGNMVRAGEELINKWKDDDDDDGMQDITLDVMGLFQTIRQLRDEFRLFIKGKENDTVYWMEGNMSYKYKSIQMYAVPIVVSDALQKYFFKQKKSVILTSATLSVNQSFQFMKERLGLQDAEQEGRLQTSILPSPFNYREQALVMIPRDFPCVKGVSDTTFHSTLMKSLADVAKITAGRMLVLFTSYRMLTDVYEPLQEALRAHHIQVLGQGIDSSNRSKLTRRFSEQLNSVLLGTSSFWEGVDIPGDTLTCLVIVRLPFQPPSHPLVEAKCDRLKQMNQNPFEKYVIPQAVIRFKQGFGRLVRTSQDKGVVIIYDTRIIEKNYGKQFLYSLPGPKMEHMATEQLVPRIGMWLNDNQ